MDRRIELDTIFRTILNSTNVYFQPPESMKIDYPAIIYSRSLYDTRFASNRVYTNKTRYDVIVVGKDPDSDIPKKLLELPFISSNRSYKINNLNHDVFTIYY